MGKTLRSCKTKQECRKIFFVSLSVCLRKKNSTHLQISPRGKRFAWELFSFSLSLSGQGQTLTEAEERRFHGKERVIMFNDCNNFQMIHIGRRRPPKFDKPFPVVIKSWTTQRCFWEETINRFQGGNSTRKISSHPPLSSLKFLLFLRRHFPIGGKRGKEKYFPVILTVKVAAFRILFLMDEIGWRSAKGQLFQARIDTRKISVHRAKNGASLWRSIVHYKSVAHQMKINSAILSRLEAFSS